MQVCTCGVKRFVECIIEICANLNVPIVCVYMYGEYVCTMCAYIRIQIYRHTHTQKTSIPRVRKCIGWSVMCVCVYVCVCVCVCV